MSIQQQVKARGLYQLYRDEQRHEERTKRMLDELEKNNRALHQSKLRLIEKLLDVQVKDELSHQFTAEGTLLAQMNTELVKEAAKRKIENEVKAHIGESRQMYSDGFIAHLDALAQEDEASARKEVREIVDKYVDPHIEMLRRTNRRQPESRLESIAVAARQVAEQKRRELNETTKYRARKDHSSRVQRVEEALRMFKRGIGDLTQLFNLPPVEYKTDIGKKEAEINDLRALIARQRAEEERLLQERQTQLAVIDRDQAKLVAEVDAVCQRLVLLQRELETKELDLKEMSAAQAPGSGSWATSTLQLEKDLSLAVEEEFHLRHEAEEVRKTVDVISVERSALDAEISDSIAELAELQQKHQSVLTKAEERLNAEKKKMYKMREDEIDMTRKINELRFRMLNRREDIRAQKRLLRAKINVIISQLSIEDRLQSALMAKSLDLQTQAEKARARSDHHIAALNSQLNRVTIELKEKTQAISSNAETLANYMTSKDEIKGDVKMTAVQLQASIQQLLKEWSRVEWEAASGVAQVASRVDLNTRENERSLRVMGELVVLQEDVTTEGVDIVHTPTQDLERIAENMYLEVTQRSYREAKYTQSIRMLRDRLQRRARGEQVLPITRNKRMSRQDRRARHEAMERSRTAREIALQHVRRFENADSSTTRSESRAPTTMGAGGTPLGGAAVASNPNTPEYAAFRALAINFIKKEIQPLYDTNQITKKRFIDIVARVSSWFLDTHRPAAELSAQNMAEIVRKIQEVITWQDSERLRRRE